MVQRLQNFFYRPYSKMLKEFAQMAAGQPFQYVLVSRLATTLTDLSLLASKSRRWNAPTPSTKSSTPSSPPCSTGTTGSSTPASQRRTRLAPMKTCRRPLRSPRLQPSHSRIRRQTEMETAVGEHDRLQARAALPATPGPAARTRLFRAARVQPPQLAGRRWRTGKIRAL